MRVLKGSPTQVPVYHSPQHCNDGESGLITFCEADPLDMYSLDEFVCTACNNRMAVQWFTAEFADWIGERYMVGNPSGCECGSAKALGIKPYLPGHSWWCPVATE